MTATSLRLTRCATCDQLVGPDHRCPDGVTHCLCCRGRLLAGEGMKCNGCRGCRRASFPPQAWIRLSTCPLRKALEAAQVAMAKRSAAK